MTSLICLVCRCNLKDGRLFKEKEIFETDETEAEILVRGGIAKPAPVPAKKPEPVKVEPPKPAVELYKEAQNIKEIPKDEPAQAKVPEKVIAKKKGR